MLNFYSLIGEAMSNKVYNASFHSYQPEMGFKSWYILAFLG